jgi:hypothetical protein
MKKNAPTLAVPNIITLPIGKVKPYWRNPRENNVTVQKVKKSIERYGYNQLVAVDRKHVIIAGHARYLALRELGVDKIAVMVLNLDDRKARAYRIADNKTGEFSKWSPALTLELRELDTELGDLRVFFNEDLDDLLAASTGATKKSVLAKDVSEAAKKLHGQFDDKKRRFQEVVCPECGHEFVTSAETVKRVFVQDTASKSKAKKKKSKT